jgi:small-conductance mechanosensitive channel
MIGACAMKLTNAHTITPLLPDWLVAIALLFGTAVLAIAVFRSLRALVETRLKFRSPVFGILLRRAQTTLQFASVLLAGAFVAPLLPLDAGTKTALHSAVIALLILFLGWIAIVASDLTIDRYVGRLKIDVEDNLQARKMATQMRVLKRAVDILIAMLTVGLALMTFDAVRNFGISIFASAGIAGLAVGLAAKPLLGNLIAGVQLAITQPIRIDDSVVVENQWGWIEELTATYVVIRLWDWRRLIVPLSYFLETPFENWTRVSSAIIGSIFFYLDYTADLDRIRRKFDEIVKSSTLWDGRVANMQVSNISEHTIEVRALASARNASASWDLRCEIREKLLVYLQKEYPQVLPRLRAEFGGTADQARLREPADPSSANGATRGNPMSVTSG